MKQIPPKEIDRAEKLRERLFELAMQNGELSIAMQAAYRLHTIYCGEPKQSVDVNQTIHDDRPPIDQYVNEALKEVEEVRAKIIRDASGGVVH